MEILYYFHLIRPYWLLALIPLAILIWLRRQSQAQSGSWASIIDPRLLPHLLHSGPAQNKPLPSGLIFIAGFLVIFALAGPVYEKRPQPVYKTQSALVILLDLSRSMDAGDVKPSRLSRAHFKINDILKRRNEGQTALIVYAADAFVVSPLTDDAATIASQVSALQTDIMPSQGSELTIALEKAEQLFKNAGLHNGHILLITDDVKDRDIASLKDLKSNNFTTSILAIGTTDGAPMAASNGGFVKDNQGSIVIPKLNIAKLQQAALAGGGLFSLLSAGDSDINTLLSVIDIDHRPDKSLKQDDGKQSLNTDTWHEEGPWLLLLVIPLAAYSFRKGLVFALLFFILPAPQPALADTSIPVWQSLWKNKDQLASEKLEQGETQQAATLFTDPEWKAAAEYRSGNYQEAADLLSDINTVEAHYNRANALAKAGKLQQALDAYEQALTLDPDHKDAKHNHQLVEQAKQQQESQQGDSEDSSNSESSENKSDKSSDDSSQQQSDSSDSEQNNEQGQQSSDGASQPDDDDDSNNDSENDSIQQQNQDSEPTDESENGSSSEQMEPEDDSEKDQSQSKPSDEKQAQNQQSTGIDPDSIPDLDQQQTQQWLKKIPDDPGGLLKRKFKYQYSRDKKPSSSEAW